jgi:tetratricopeptide (TPR) repeat protein
VGTAPETRDGPEAWEAAARAAPAEARAALLAEADRLRGGDDAGRLRALHLSRGLAADLDPARDEDAARIRFVFASSGRRDELIEDLARATATAARDPAFRLEAEILRGQAAADAGRLEEAEDLFLALLRRERGTGSRTERFVCLCLARIYAQQRRGFEALCLSRAAADLARKAGDAWDLCIARARTCYALQVLDDGERLVPAVEELDRALDAVPPATGRPLRYGVWMFRTENALSVGDAAGARRALRGLLGLADAAGRLPGDPRQPLHLDAETLLLEGKPREALDRIAALRTLPLYLESSEIIVNHLEARCRAAAGEPEVARRIVESNLDALEAEPEPDPFGIAYRITWATASARLLREFGAPAEEVCRAHDLAAGWVIRRIVEIDRTIEALPELDGVAPEDLQTLTAHRHRFLRAQGDILGRVADLYGDSPPPGLAHGRTGDEEGYFHACAWCRRVRTSDGRWLPIGEFLPDDRRLRISHGICDACRERWTARAAGGSGA